MIPELSPVVEWSQVLEEMSAADKTLLFYEGEGRPGLPRVWSRQGQKPLALIIGPEGGFEDVELVLAREKGAEVVTLGSRILRTETAAIVAATACQVLYGDMVP